jgi:hypothetical protein
MFDVHPLSHSHHHHHANMPVINVENVNFYSTINNSNEDLMHHHHHHHLRQDSKSSASLHYLHHGAKASPGCSGCLPSMMHMHPNGTAGIDAGMQPPPPPLASSLHHHHLHHPTSQSSPTKKIKMSSHCNQAAVTAAAVAMNLAKLLSVSNGSSSPPRQIAQSNLEIQKSSATAKPTKSGKNQDVSVSKKKKNLVAASGNASKKSKQKSSGEPFFSLLFLRVYSGSET